MGDPSDDDVPTVTSSSELRSDEDAPGSAADADDRTIQKPPDAVAAVEADAERDRERTMMAKAPKPPASTRSPISSPAPSVPVPTPRSAAALSVVSVDKLPPPPTTPLRPRLPSSPSHPSSSSAPFSAGTGPVTPAMPPMRPRAASSPGSLSPGLRPIPTPQPFAAKAEAASVARAEPVKNEPAKSDSKSDVRTVQSTRGSGSDDVEGPPTLESEPPPSEQATSPKSPAMVGASVAPQTPKMANAPTIPTIPKSAKSPTAAAPMTPKMQAKPPAKPQTVASAGAPERSPSKPETDGDGDGDGDGDSITATAPRVLAPIIPLAPSNQVEIRTLEDDDSADETEVKTLAAEIGDIVRNARVPSEAEALDDSVTAHSPVPPGAPGSGKPAAGGVIRIGAKSLMSGAPKAAGAGAYNPDEEDSVTARGLAVGADYPDDSVTAHSPNAGPPLPAAIDGETEGTTKRVRRKRLGEKDDPSATEADALDDSVTAAAPGHLTNMLRVIASPSDEGEEAADDDEAQAHTQVMLNAPVKPPVHSRRGGVPDGPSSASGSFGAGQDGLGGERASVGALGIPQRERRHSGQIRGPMPSDAGFAPSPSDRVSHSPFGPVPVPVEGEDRKPPYALVVGVVAAISILIPVLLFIILSQSGDDAAPRVTSQPWPDRVGVTGPRPKAGKPAPSTTSVHPNNGGGMNNRSPFRH